MFTLPERGSPPEIAMDDLAGNLVDALDCGWRLACAVPTPLIFLGRSFFEIGSRRAGRKVLGSRTSGAHGA